MGSAKPTAASAQLISTVWGGPAWGTGSWQTDFFLSPSHVCLHASIPSHFISVRTLVTSNDDLRPAATRDLVPVAKGGKIQPRPPDSSMAVGLSWLPLVAPRRANVD
jgi:hypothetical protein